MTTRLRYFAIGILIAVVLMAISMVSELSTSVRQFAIVVTIGVLGAVCLVLLLLHRRTTWEPGLYRARIRSRLEALTTAARAGRSAATGQAAEAAETGTGLKRAHDLRSLVVGHYRISGRSLVGMLGGLGCKADSRTEFPAVLAGLAERAYDLVFIDCEMPDMDAAFLAREIRKQGDLCRRQPYIIAVTADISAMHHARCLRAGINDFLAKPVRPEILEAGLRRWASLSTQYAAPSARPETSSVPPIDPQALSRLRDRAGRRSDKFVRGYIDLFLQDTGERLEVLRAALERRDHHLLGREIHALKGACLEFGVSQMSVYCDELRDASRDGRVDELPDALRRIKSEFERVKPVFEEARNRSG